MNQEKLRADSMNDWPYDGRDQCHQEQEADRLRLQAEIQEAWDDLMASLERKDWIDQDDQIKLLKSVLGVK